MKRALLVLLLATTAAAGERSEKRQLISELLQLIDAKAHMQASFENFLGAMTSTFGESSGNIEINDLPEEYRAQYEAEQKRQQEKMRTFQERMYTHIDYEKYFDEVYVPMFEARFTEDELRELIAFYRTKAGQKLAALQPQLGIGAKGMDVLRAASEATQRDIEAEDKKRNPWRETLSDMRSIATAVEARATDTSEDYPNISFEQLKLLIAPTYIREVPQTDVWGTPYFYIGDGQHYRIVSAGSDRRFDWSSRQLALPMEPHVSEDDAEDIIFQDGNFLQSPPEREQ